jgi:AMMECR1 domain-containing protein
MAIDPDVQTKLDELRADLEDQIANIQVGDLGISVAQARYASALFGKLATRPPADQIVFLDELTTHIVSMP